jgi:hypothetical protein
VGESARAENLTPKKTPTLHKSKTHRLLLARKLNPAMETKTEVRPAPNTARVRAPEQKEIEENEGT